MSAHRTAKDLHFASVQMVDPGNAGTITVDRSPAVVALVSGGVETRTLARPTRVGVQVVIYMEVDGGDITLSVTGGYNEAGDTTFLFDDAGEFAEFRAAYDGTNYYWRKTSDHATQASTEFLQDVTAGTAEGEKAVVLDANKEIETITKATITTTETGTINEVVAGSGVTIDGAVIRDGQVHGIQDDPAAKAGAATITIADILGGIVTLDHTTGATVALTLDTGTAMDTGMPASFGTNQFIDWYLINLSAAALDTGTVTAASGHTIVGNPIVQSEHSSTGGEMGSAGHFRSRRTAANTWVTYRVS